MSAVRSLCGLLGRLHVHAQLDPATTPAALGRALATAVSLNAWMSVEGLELVGLAALSALGEMLHGLLHAAITRASHVQLAGESVPSPWAFGGAGLGTTTAGAEAMHTAANGNHASTAPASPPAKTAGGGRSPPGQHHHHHHHHHPKGQSPASGPRMVKATPGVFLSLPMAAYLPVSHDAAPPAFEAAPVAAASTAAAVAFLTEAVHRSGPFPHELCELARRAGRCVALHTSDLSVALEAGLRCAGLRDAPEAGRAVGSWFRLAAVQLGAPPQLRLDAVTVRGMLTYIQRVWMLAGAGSAGEGGAGTGAGAGAGAGAGVGSARVSGMGSGSGGGAAQGAAAASSAGRVGGSALDAVDAAMRAVVLPAADPEDLPALTRLLDQVIGFAQRTSAPPPDAAAGSGGPGVSTPAGSSRSTPQLSLPMTPGLMGPAGGSAGGAAGGAGSGVFNVREALQAVLVMAKEAHAAAAADPSPRPARLGRTPPSLPGGGSTATSRVEPGSAVSSPARKTRASMAAAAAANASAAAAGPPGTPLVLPHSAMASPPDAIPAPQPAWFPALAHLAFASAPALVGAAAAIHDALLGSRAVLLVGAPGAGKSSAWRALVAATHGPEALQSPDAVLHLFPEALYPAARAGFQLGPGVDEDAPHLADCGGGGAGPDGRAPTDWLLRRLEGVRRWALRRRPEGASVQSGSAAVVGVAPRWVVLDGPLGTPAADVMASLLLMGAGGRGAGGAGGTGGGKVLPSGSTVAAPSDAAHVLWETSSLAGASPALLSAVPVVHVPGSGAAAGGGLWDAEAALSAAVRAVIKQQGMVSGLHTCV